MLQQIVYISYIIYWSFIEKGKLKHYIVHKLIIKAPRLGEGFDKKVLERKSNTEDSMDTSVSEIYKNFIGNPPQL